MSHPITKPSDLFFTSDWIDVLEYDQMIVDAVLEKYKNTKEAKEDWKKCIDMHFKEFVRDCLNSSSPVERAVGGRFRYWGK